MAEILFIQSPRISAPGSAGLPGRSSERLVFGLHENDFYRKHDEAEYDNPKHEHEAKRQRRRFLTDIRHTTPPECVVIGSVCVNASVRPRLGEPAEGSGNNGKKRKCAEVGGHVDVR